MNFLIDAKKAVGVLTFMESAAVAAHFLNADQAAVASAVLGACSAVITYTLRNGPKPSNGKHES